MRFSGLRILKEGLTGNKGWGAHWRDPEPKAEYDAIIIGGGGMVCRPLTILRRTMA